MARPTWYFSSIAVVAAMFATHSTAQDQIASGSRYDPATILLANVRSGSAQDAYLENLIEAYRAVDSDGNGLDRDDVARMDTRLREQALAGIASRIARYERQIAEMDANGDGALTEAEILAAIEDRRSGRKGAEGIFEIYDFDKDGLVELSDLVRSPGRRSQIFTEADINGDARLNQEEMLAAFAAMRPAVTEEPNIQFDKIDLDGNGVVTAAEMAGQSVPSALNTRKQDRRNRMFERIFQLDNNGDSRLAESELTAAFLRQFARIDTDGDGTVSSSEYRAGRRTVKVAQNIATLPLCKLPQPAGAAEAVAIAAISGQLGSTVAIGGQDRETSIVEVNVEPGDTPLYILLMTEDPVIWDISGATERVSQVVILSETHDAAGNAMAGVTGVAQARVHFGSDCFPVRKARNQANYGSAQLETVIAAVTGLETRAASGRIGKAFLPSLQIERFNGGVPPPEGFDPDIWWTVTDERPRGLGNPELASIVSATSVERYELLPGEFGLARLAYQGIVEPTKHDDEFRLLQSLERFPGGLRDSGRVSFVLSEGIARPEGEFGRGCLYAADGETVIEGDYCTRYPRGNAVQIRIGEDGKSCLYRYGGEMAGCFPEDGGPLRAVETDEGTTFEPVPAEERTDEMAPQIMPAPPSDYVSPIEIIPAGLRQRW